MYVLYSPQSEGKYQLHLLMQPNPTWCVHVCGRESDRKRVCIRMMTIQTHISRATNLQWINEILLAKKFTGRHENIQTRVMILTFSKYRKVHKYGHRYMNYWSYSVHMRYVSSGWEKYIYPYKWWKKDLYLPSLSF